MQLCPKCKNLVDFDFIESLPNYSVTEKANYEIKERYPLKLIDYLPFCDTCKTIMTEDECIVKIV